MITLIHLERSRSERIVWLLEELGLPYRLRSFAREPDLYAPPAMRNAHPLGRAPVIEDGDVTLAESGAIVEYILARYGGGRLVPATASPDFPRYLHWLHYAEGSLMTQLLREWSVDRIAAVPDGHPGMARLREQTRLHLRHVEAGLMPGPYFAGEAFTAADVMMAYPFTSFRRIRPLDLSSAPALLAWIERIESRPAFRRALAAG